jgi:ABC-type oligopeptide transport system substrate-binding subunit
MHRRLWFSVAMLAAGASLLVAASFASASSASPSIHNGGTLKIGGTGNLDSIDPQIAYGTTSWWFEFATRANLYTYPDKSGAAGGKLVPEVAKGFTVSKNGRTYTFHLKKGFKFSDGKPVTAASFAYAIKRSLNKDLASPGGSFVSDPSAVNIVGAAKYNAGNASNVSGVKAKGYTLKITEVRADPNLITIMAMPFFQATSTKLPLTSEVINVNKVGDLPTAGPYTWSYNNPNHQANIVRNPHYGGKRQHHIAGAEFDMRLNVNTCYNETKANQLDIGCVPPAEIPNVVQTYGLSRTKPVKTGQFWVTSATCTFYQAMNMAKPLFSPSHLKARQAVNYAVDRKDYIAQRGLYGGIPWTHILPPGMAGSVRTQPYPLRRNLAKAKSLGAGRGQHLIYFYQSAGSVGPKQYQVALRDLSDLGYNVEGRGFAGFNIYTAAGTKGSPHDVVGQVGWCQDYPDPYDFINVLMDGTKILPENNVNLAYFNVKKWNKAMQHAARLTGKARYRAYGKLDIDITKQAAPWAAMGDSTNQFFYSNKVAPKTMSYQTVYQYPSLNILAFK